MQSVTWSRGSVLTEVYVISMRLCDCICTVPVPRRSELVQGTLSRAEGKSTQSPVWVSLSNRSSCHCEHDTATSARPCLSSEKQTTPAIQPHLSRCLNQLEHGPKDCRNRPSADLHEQSSSAQPHGDPVSPSPNCAKLRKLPVQLP